MRSAATNPAASPIPPAHTRGTPRSPSSFTSCSALFGPACPPARWFTAIRPRTPESSPFSAHFRSVTSWYTRSPPWATRSTTHRGLRCCSRSALPATAAAAAAEDRVKRPRLTTRQQRAWRKLLRPLLRVPYEEPICQYPRPRGVVLVVRVEILKRYP